jgi:hypothetical protein
VVERLAPCRRRREKRGGANTTGSDAPLQSILKGCGIGVADRASPRPCRGALWFRPVVSRRHVFGDDGGKA